MGTKEAPVRSAKLAAPHKRASPSGADSRKRSLKPTGPVLPPSIGERAIALTMATRPRDALIRNWELALALEIKPALDTKKLSSAFRSVLNLHKRLRSVYFVRDDDVTVRTLPVEAFDLEVVDATSLSAAALTEELHTRVDKPWNMSVGPQITLTAFQRPKDRMVLLLRINHLLVDGWSIELLLRDLLMFYVGLPVETGAVASYEQYIAWETAFVQSPAGRAQREFWRRKLARLGPRLKLPYDRPPTSPFVQNSANAPFAFDRAETTTIREFSGKSGVSVYAFMLATYQILLTHLSGETDLTALVTTAHRTHADFAGTVGLVSNLIAFRNPVVGSGTFRQQLARAGRTIVEALSNQDCPIRIVAEDLAANQLALATTFGTPDSAFDQIGLYMLTPNQSGLPDAGLRSLFEPDRKFKMGPFELRTLELPRNDATRELTLFFNEVGDRLLAFFAYNADIFNESTVIGFIDKFRAIARLGLERPDRSVDDIMAALKV